MLYTVNTLFYFIYLIYLHTQCAFCFVLFFLSFLFLIAFSFSFSAFPSLRVDEIKLWLTPSNQSLVIVCPQAILPPPRLDFSICRGTFPSNHERGF